jgi:hypothetical protein
MQTPQTKENIMTTSSSSRKLGLIVMMAALAFWISSLGTAYA